MKRHPLLVIFAALLSILYGLIAAAQILGFAQVFEKYSYFVLAGALSALVFYVFFRSEVFFSDDFIPLKAIQQSTVSRVILISAGCILFLILVFLPLLRWPFSAITPELPWDAGLYHFPKAAELISSRSFWDLTIAYGEYPSGYESLIAFALLLNRAGLLIGTVHAVIALFLYLAMILLILQRVKFPRAYIFFLVSLLFIGYLLFPQLDSNLWWIFWEQVSLVGKNDVFLAAAVLSVILFIPRSQQGPFFPAGLAVASMLAITIKPTSGLLVVFAWMVMLVGLIRKREWKNQWKALLLSLVILLPGILWTVRNLAVQRSLFSAASMQISEWSIASNLSNPYFYENIPQHLYIILILLVISLIVAIFKRSLRMEVAIAAILLVSFALTPASAFFGSNQERAQIGWRFAMALLVYILILVLILLEPLTTRVFHWLDGKKLASLLVAGLIAAFGIWAVASHLNLFASSPENAIILRDQFRKPVGAQGYHSVYDYIQKNVTHSVVIVENGLPYFLYDPGFTNSITRSRPPDYFVMVKYPDKDFSRFSTYPDSSDWNSAWGLVYEDSQGRVYRRK